MRILALEQSGRTVSAALEVDGEMGELSAPRGEGGEALLDFVESLLARAGIGGESLDVLAVGVGPGSYTGVRVALGLAQGMAEAWGRPLLGLSGCEALARRVCAQTGWSGPALVALEAGLGESATLWVRPGRAVEPEHHALLDGPALLAAGFSGPDPFLAAGTGLPVSRPDGWARCVCYFPDLEASARDYLPLARERLRTGVLTPAADITPLYLRPAVSPRERA